MTSKKLKTTKEKEESAPQLGVQQPTKKQNKTTKKAKQINGRNHDKEKHHEINTMFTQTKNITAYPNKCRTHNWKPKINTKKYYDIPTRRTSTKTDYLVVTRC